MIQISKTQFNGTTEELQARVTAFKAALSAHATTIGVPAPREDDLVEYLAKQLDTFEVVEGENPLQEKPSPQPVDPIVEQRLSLSAQINILEYDCNAVMRRAVLGDESARIALAGLDEQIAGLKRQIAALS